MYFSREFDYAIQEWREEQRKEEKCKKILALINDDTSTEGEKESARRALKRIGG